jgi:hypothetical protein
MVLSCLVLAGDLLLLPIVSVGPVRFSPLWRTSAVKASIVAWQAYSRYHSGSFPPDLLMSTAACVLAAAALVAALVNRSRLGAIGLAGTTALLAGGAAATIPFAGARWHATLGHQLVGPGVWVAAVAGLTAAITAAASAAFTEAAYDETATAAPRLGFTAVVALVGVAGLVGLGLVGHTKSGNSFNSNFSSTSGTTPSYYTATTPYIPTTPAGVLATQFTFTESAPGGYSASGTLSLGQPQQYRSGLRQGDLIAGSACAINSPTDAVIPGTLRLTNESGNFASQVVAHMNWSSDAITAVELKYSDGPTCQTSGSTGFGLQSNDTLQSGQSVAVNLFVVISNYFSPDYSNGNPSMLASAGLFLASGTNKNGVVWSPNGANGPGVTRSSDYSSTWVLPVLPSAVRMPAATTVPDTVPADTSTTTMMVPSGSTFGPYPVISTNLHVRSAPTPVAPIVGTLAMGDQVNIDCITQGPAVIDATGASITTWDHITSPRGYVADAFINTGGSQAAAPTCSP